MISKIQKPFLIRTMNLPISKFGNFEQGIYNSTNKNEIIVQSKVTCLLDTPIINEGKTLFSKNFNLYIQWLSYKTQKFVVLLGFKLHVNLFIEDQIRGYIINKTTNEKFEKEYWEYFNQRYNILSYP